MAMTGARLPLALAATAALAMPALLLGVPMLVGPDPVAGGQARAARPLAPPPLPPLAAIYRRPLFAAAGDVPLPEDAPELLGIAGRIDADAVAMVRADDGGTRTLRPGDSVDGWRLVALAVDAASFVRGTQTVRVPVAGTDQAGGEGAGQEGDPPPAAD